MSDVRVMREIAPGAQIDPDAHLGHWCVIGPQVRIGPGTTLEDRVAIAGQTWIGRNNFIGGGSVLGGEPQDLKYRGQDTWLLIGNDNRIGRNVTAHVGTEEGGWVTYIGHGNHLLDTCHVAHDCFVMNNACVGRGVLLAGHIVVQTGAVIEDMTGIHHFSRIGKYSRVGPRTPVRRDVPPFTDFYSEDYYWDPPMVRGLHEHGLAAAKLPQPQEEQLRQALTWLFDDESAMATKIEQLQNAGSMGPELAYLCQFCRESLDGLYGRYRERFRGQIPPEAHEVLPADMLDFIQRNMPCR